MVAALVLFLAARQPLLELFDARLKTLRVTHAVQHADRPTSASAAVPAFVAQLQADRSSHYYALRPDDRAISRAW